MRIRFLLVWGGRGWGEAEEGEEFEIPCGPSDGGGLDTEGLPMEGGTGEGEDGGEDAAVDGGVTDDAAFLDVFFSGFELGFNEEDGGRVGEEDAVHSGEDEGQGDEGAVGDAEGGAGVEVGGIEVAGVYFFTEDDAGVAAEAWVELVVADIDGVDGGGAVLEEAIGEAAGGGADIEADAAVCGEGGPGGEGGVELTAAAGDEGLLVTDADGGGIGDEAAGLIDGEVGDEDVTGTDEALGLFPAFGEGTLDEEAIEAFAVGGRIIWGGGGRVGVHWRRYG